MNPTRFTAARVLRALAVAAGALSAIAGVGLMTTSSPAGPPTGTTAAPTAHDFAFTAIDGTPLPLSQFAGKAVLVVNTASLCGFTPQYAELQTLWDTYRGRGLVVLGVPSNDFGGQEPKGNDEIRSFCEITFGVTFPMTEKTVVTGAEAHPFYRWAAAELGFLAKPRWNFHKYLVGTDGRLQTWFTSLTSPTAASLQKAIEAALPR